MVQVQTGNMLDVVVEGKSLGLKPRGAKEIIWLPEPESLALVLLAELERLKPDTPASPLTVPTCLKCGHHSVDREGRCVFEYRRLNIPNDVRYCGCKCELPTAQGDTREGEVNDNSGK